MIVDLSPYQLLMRTFLCAFTASFEPHHSGAISVKVIPGFGVIDQKDPDVILPDQPVVVVHVPNWVNQDGIVENFRSRG